MRDLQILLQRLGFIVSGGNTIGMYNFFAQFGERDTAYVSRASRLAAPGWDAINIVFGDYVPARMMRDLEREMRDSYRFRYFTVTRVGGRRVWIMTLQRILRLTGVSGIAAPQPAIDPTWLYFTMPEGGSVTLTKNGTPKAVTLEYSLDNGSTWTEWVETAGVRSLSLNAGQNMHVRNTSATQTGLSTSSANYYQFSFDNIVYAGGNLNSLLCAIPENVTTLAVSCFRFLFQGCTSLTLHEDFTLPATTLAASCYQSMFQNCTSLTLHEDFTLPATTLASECYRAMFNGCTSLTLPEGFTLPATTLASYCYYYMFQNCTSLTIPEGFTLPATTLVEFCYQSMFQNCTSLTLHEDFTLPATTLATSCYRHMFYGCISLNTMRTLMTDISATNCLTNWLSGVAATGDFYCEQSLTIPTGMSGIPTGWTRHDI